MWLPSSDHKYCRKLQMAVPLPNSAHTTSPNAMKVRPERAPSALTTWIPLLPRRAGVRIRDPALHCSPSALAPRAHVLVGEPQQRLRVGQDSRGREPSFAGS